MKKLFCFLLCFGLVLPVLAEQRYVYIVKTAVVEAGQLSGQTQVGDVIATYPYTEQYKPSAKILNKYLVKVVDLTEAERQALVAPLERNVTLTQIDQFPVSQTKEKRAEILSTFPDANLLKIADVDDTRFILFEYTQPVTLRARKRSVDITGLSDEQEEIVEKTTFASLVSVKPDPVFYDYTE